MLMYPIKSFSNLKRKKVAALKGNFICSYVPSSFLAVLLFLFLLCRKTNKIIIILFIKGHSIKSIGLNSY